MRRFFAIWMRELMACFLSPVAYVTMVVFLSVSGWVYLQLVEGHVGSNHTLPELLFKVVIFFWLPILTTVVTMRLFAEEKRSGTLETLMTAPVTEAEAVLGKFAGAVTFVVFVAVPAVGAIFVLTLLSPALVRIDLGAVAGGSLLLVLMSSLCVSIGLLASLLTRNQIIAAICCFAGVLVPLLVGEVVAAMPLTPLGLAGFVSARMHVVDFAFSLYCRRSPWS